MGYDPGVDLVLGFQIQVKDIMEQINSQEKGCRHDFDRSSNNFCSFCGAESYVSKTIFRSKLKIKDKIQEVLSIGDFFESIIYHESKNGALYVRPINVHYNEKYTLETQICIGILIDSYYGYGKMCEIDVVDINYHLRNNTLNQINHLTKKTIKLWMMDVGSS